MLRNLSETLGEKFPAATRGYSLVKCARLDDAQFSELLEREASPVEGQSLQQKLKIRKEEIIKANKKIIKNGKSKDVGHFLVQKL